MAGLNADVIAVLNERAADAAAGRLERRFAQAGRVSGQQFEQAFEAEVARSNLAADAVGQALRTRMARHGTQAGASFGSSFGSELAQSLPGIGGFASAMSGYEGAAGKAGAVAGRAMGLAFTTAAAGLIGAAGYTIFKGFERYEAIDAARNRLENLNRTMQATGRQAIDVGAVMETVNAAVMDTPFALDQAFSVATRAMASNTGDLQRFMGVVTDAAGFAGSGIDEIGEAFLKVANRGKVSMEEITNELRNMPILPWLQQQLNVSGAELAKMISQGKVGLEDLMRAVEANAAGFAKSAGDTVAGAMANAQTAVARLGANALGAMFGKPAEDSNELVEVLKTLRERLDDVNAWVTANQENIKRTFDGAVDAVGDLTGAISGVLGILDRVGIGVDDVVKAFIAWKTIQGVTSLADKLGGVSTTLATTLPNSADKGAKGISAALSRVAVPAWLAAMLGEGLNDTINTQLEQNAPQAHSWNHSYTPDQLGKAARDWVDRNILGEREESSGGGSAGLETLPGFNMRPPAPPGAAPNMPPMPGIDMRWDPQRGWVPKDGPAGGDILPPPGNGEGGGSGSRAPVLPLPAEYGQPPAPGESIELWRERMANIMAHHNVEEARARLTQLEADGTAEAGEVVAARNAVREAEMRAWESDRAFRESQMAQMATQVPFDPRYGQAPRPGQTAQQYGAESSFYEAQQKAAQAAADYQALQATGTATTEELAAAHNAAVKATNDQYQAQLRLAEAYSGTTGAAEELGAKLDDDLGISRGLPGLVDNFVRALMNVAMAPVLGPLSQIAGDPEKSGSGLIGMLFGGGSGASAMPPISAPAWQPGAATSAGATTGGYPGDAALLANVPAGTYSQTGSADLTQGLADCSSAVEDLVNLMDGQPTAGRSMSTANAAEWLTSRGFLPGTGGPGDFRVAFNSGHMQATLPGGTPFNWGSSEAAARAGVGGSGADDPALTSRYYRPAGGTGGPGVPPGGFAQLPGTPYGSITISAQSVTVVGGTGGGGAPGTPGGPPGAAPVGQSLWDEIAKYESNNDWSNNNTGGHSTSSGAPRGGLQITDGTWRAFGGTEFAPTANLATREQQIAIANRIAFTGHNGTPPQGLGAWEVVTKGLTPNVTTSTPASAFGGGATPSPSRPGTSGVPQRPLGPAPAGQTWDYTQGRWVPVGSQPPSAQNVPSTSPSVSGSTQTPFGPIAGPADPSLTPALPNITGGGGESAMFGLPNGGGPAAPSQSVAGGRQIGAGLPASGGASWSGGGLIGAAISGALGAAGGAAGGFGGGAASAGAQTGVQLLGRAAGAAGQYAGNIATGLLETFSLNDSALADPGSSWLGRLGIAAMGMRPALPNTAGMLGGEQNPNMAEGGKPQPPGPLTPQQAAEHAANQGGEPGPGNQTNVTNNVSVTNNRQTEDQTGQVVAAHLNAQQAAVQPR